MHKKPSPKRIAAAGMMLLAVFLLGRWSASEKDATTEPQTPRKESPEKAGLWTCSMHPQIKLPKPGKCPICFMDLIPMQDGGASEEGPRVLAMSDAAMKLAEIVTQRVERKSVEKEVRMVGKVEYDETQLSYITAWVGGRIDKLYVDYTGIQIRKGDHLVDLYSPELMSAQEELLQASRTLARLDQSNVSIVKSTARQLVESTREKLRLWGLTQAQIREIEERGTIVEHITINAPVGGIVIHRNGTDGMYVKTGTTIYTIANLAKVWVKLDAYESDLQWIRYGQDVAFTTTAYPGKVFHGKISFIDPVLNERTRTVKVRVNVSNRDMALKPGMFVSGIVRSKIAARGKVLEPSLAGKWISPMHPEIIKNKAGTCDICGMPLVKAEDLGYVTVRGGALPLVIAASAPLITGTRAVVYLKIPGRSRPTFEGREIVLGPRAGDYYLVESGLSEGDEVVVHGNFKIDSALQIQAKPAMMNPMGGGPAPGHHHGGSTDTAAAPAQSSGRLGGPDFHRSMGGLVDAYLAFQKALAGDESAHLHHLLAGLHGGLQGVKAQGLGKRAGPAWQEIAAEIRTSLDALDQVQPGDIEAYREHFADLSGVMVRLLDTMGTRDGAPLYAMACPMADARWIQNTPEVANPYFGKSMLRCGNLIKIFSDAPPARDDGDGGRP